MAVTVPGDHLTADCRKALLAEETLRRVSGFAVRGAAEVQAWLDDNGPDWGFPGSLRPMMEEVHLQPLLDLASFIESKVSTYFLWVGDISDTATAQALFTAVRVDVYPPTVAKMRRALDCFDVSRTPPGERSWRTRASVSGDLLHQIRDETSLLLVGPTLPMALDEMSLEDASFYNYAIAPLWGGFCWAGTLVDSVLRTVQAQPYRRSGASGCTYSSSSCR